MFRSPSLRWVSIASISAGLIGLPSALPTDAVAGPGLPTQTKVYRYTGEWGYFTVPAGVTSLGLDIRGGRGGKGGYDLEEGGLPKPQGRVSGTMPMAGTGDELIRIAVGGNGGNGTVCMPGIGGLGGGNPAGFTGGKGGDAGLPYGCSGGGGGGGGASIVQLPNGFPDFVAARDAVVAGGGGGGFGAGAHPAPRAFSWWSIVSSGAPWIQLDVPSLPLLSEITRGEYDDGTVSDGYSTGITGTAGQGWGNTLDPGGVDFKGPSWDGGGAGGGGGGIRGGLGGWVSSQYDVSAQPGKTGMNRAGDADTDLSSFLASTYELADEGSVTLTWQGPAAPSISGPSGRTRRTDASVAITGAPGATFTCRVDDRPAVSCGPTFTASALAVGDHVIAVSQSISGVSSEPAVVSWTVEPPFVAPTVTSVRPSITKVSGRWRISLGATFNTGEDYRSPAQLLTVQVSTSAAKPSDTQSAPSAPSYASGVVPWAAEVSRQSLAKPRWVRVGNRAGRWTRWVAIP